MLVLRTGLAISTEIKIIAHSTLVADATDVGRESLGARAKGTITADARMDDLRSQAAERLSKGLIDRHETMLGVGFAAILMACRAIIPVRAIKALVADTSNVLITAITDGLMNLVTTRSKFRRDGLRHASASDGGSESVARVVAVNSL